MILWFCLASELIKQSSVINERGVYRVKVEGLFACPLDVIARTLTAVRA